MQYIPPPPVSDKNTEPDSELVIRVERSYLKLVSCLKCHKKSTIITVLLNESSTTSKQSPDHLFNVGLSEKMLPNFEIMRLF